MNDLEISKLTNQVKKIADLVPEIKLIYLFGSQAVDRVNEESDLDIAVFVENQDEVSVRKLLVKFNQVGINPINLDLSVVDLNSSPLFLLQIIKKGKCLYKRKETLQASIEGKIMQRYYDTQHMRDIYSYYLDKSIKEGTYGR